MNDPHHIIAVIGPTAIGKTKLAIELAGRFQSNIISADSRQFFKEMTIGTAVPSQNELKAAPHHFIQHKSIHDSYSVGDFEREALSAIDEFSKNTKITILVGGSGLYINALLYGLDEFPEVPEKIRSELNAQYQKFGIAWLQEKLKQVDPEYYEVVDTMNPQRMIRALEVFQASKVPFSRWRSKTKKQRPFTFQLIGLQAQRPYIYERINQRVDEMVKNGLIQEAQKLHQHKALNALQTVGYRELFEAFEDKISLDQAVEMIKQNTRRFAKRQMTWFKKNSEIKWFDHDVPLNQILDSIQR